MNKQSNSMNTTKLTKEQCKQLSDAEILNLVQKAQGHTGKDFSDYLNCDFSYSYLTGLLRDRGYENGWHKVTNEPATAQKSTVIQMKKSDQPTTRQTFVIDKSVANEWKEFNQNVPFKSVTISFALRRFIEEYKSGRIKFELEI